MAVSLYQFHSQSSQDLSRELLKVDAPSNINNKGIYFDETSSEHSDDSRRASVESIMQSLISILRTIPMTPFSYR